MYEQIVFENHNGKKITFGDGSGYYVNENDLRDYAWSYTTANNKIKSLSRGVTSKKVPIVITGVSESDAIMMKNNLMNYADEDIYANEKGKIWIGEYYYSCFITGSSKSRYSIAKNHIKIDLTLVTDQPYWTKETTYEYKVIISEMQGGYDFPHDYGLDYGNSTPTVFTNGNYAPSNFRLVVYGVCDEIDVYIGNNRYNITTSLSATEYAVIDSREKKAYKVAYDGTTTSIFGLRNRDYDLFAKVETGLNAIQRDTWIDITIYDERSEPLWT